MPSPANCKMLVDELKKADDDIAGNVDVSSKAERRAF